jgi:hypothetical protein
MEWYEKIPKSNRDQALAEMTDGQYLGILRAGAARNKKDEDLTLTKMSELTATPRKVLVEIEDGHKPVTYAIAKAYCTAMGVQVEILKRAGKKALKWEEAPMPAREHLDMAGIKARAAERGEKTKADSRQRKEAAANGDGLLDKDVDLASASSAVVRNHRHENVVVVLNTNNGVLSIDLFDDDPKYLPKPLYELGMHGVRVVALRAVPYDLDKEHVIDVPVQVRRQT